MTTLKFTTKKCFNCTRWAESTSDNNYPTICECVCDGMDCYEAANPALILNIYCRVEMYDSKKYKWHAYHEDCGGGFFETLCGAYEYAISKEREFDEWLYRMGDGNYYDEYYEDEIESVSECSDCVYNENCNMRHACYSNNLCHKKTTEEQEELDRLLEEGLLF